MTNCISISYQTLYTDKLRQKYIVLGNVDQITFIEHSVLAKLAEKFQTQTCLWLSCPEAL